MKQTNQHLLMQNRIFVKHPMVPRCCIQYGEICHQYTEYEVKNYKDAIVVFDGYENTYEYKIHDTSGMI